MLTPGGRLVLHGPYFVEGRPTAPSNIAFDEALRHGLARERVVDMPSNNLTLVFRRTDVRAPVWLRREFTIFRLVRGLGATR